MIKHSKEYLQPVGAMFELTSNCNLRCSHCYVSSGEYSLNLELTDSEWLELLDTLLKKGICGILLTGGEPLLKMDLVKKIISKLSSHPNIQISLATNGLLIDTEFLEFFSSVPNKKLIQISIDGAYPELHDQVRKVSGAWKKSIEACILASNYPIKLQIAHTVNKINLPFLEDMFKLSIILGVNSLGIGAAVPLGRGHTDKDDIILSIEQRESLDTVLNSLKNKYKHVIDTNFASPGGIQYYKSYLDYFQDWLLVKPEGSIKLENRLPFIIGNIRYESLDNLWLKLNYFQKSPYVINIIKNCIENDIEIDNQDFIYLNTIEEGSI